MASYLETSSLKSNSPRNVEGDQDLAVVDDVA